MQLNDFVISMANGFLFIYLFRFLDFEKKPWSALQCEALLYNFSVFSTFELKKVTLFLSTYWNVETKGAKCVS